MTSRPIITEEPITPGQVVRASRTFCRSVRQLSTHDAIRGHMNLPDVSVSEHDLYRTGE